MPEPELIRAAIALQGTSTAILANACGLSPNRLRRALSRGKNTVKLSEEEQKIIESAFRYIGIYFARNGVWEDRERSLGWGFLSNQVDWFLTKDPWSHPKKLRESKFVEYSSHQKPFK